MAAGSFRQNQINVVQRTDALFLAWYHLDVAVEDERKNRVRQPMTNQADGGVLILVVEDVEETRDGIEKLLTTDGYRVDPARGEEDAIVRARRERPKLILVSLGPQVDVVATVRRIRERAELSDEIPVVIFCVETIPEGAEVKIGANVYVTRPDSFDQLRSFLGRLLPLLPLTS